MSVRVENINKNIIEWAIIRSGKDLEEFYAKKPDVEKWTKGEKWPTVKQLEEFTNSVHVPFGYMFLSKPPKEEVPLSFFRTGTRKRRQVSLNVLHIVQMIEERQLWLSDYLDELGFSDLSYVGKFTINDDYKEIVADIRRTLDIEINWAQNYRNWEDALRQLINKIEEAGIIITFSGVVGNNTHRPIDVDECRGFVMVNKKAPFLFVNSADAPAAQMFTLVHELAHIWLGASAGFDMKHMMPADDPIEILCNKVAAEFLVPEDQLYRYWNQVHDFKQISMAFKVSPIVIARRALDLKLIQREDFLKFYLPYMDTFREKKSKASGGEFYATAKRRTSIRFVAFVDNAVRENRLLYRDAFKLTSLKRGSYNKFVTDFLYT